MVSIKSTYAMGLLYGFICELRNEGWRIDLFLNEEQLYAKTESIRIEFRRDIQEGDDILDGNAALTLREDWSVVANKLNEVHANESRKESTEDVDVNSDSRAANEEENVEEDTQSDVLLPILSDDDAQYEPEEENSKV